MALKDLIATPGEAAAARIVKLFRYTGEAGEQLRCAIEDEVDKAVAAERERVAKFLESQASPYDNYPQYFARMIRENATAQ